MIECGCDFGLYVGLYCVVMGGSECECELM